MKNTFFRGAVWFVCGLLLCAAPLNAQSFQDRFSWALGGTILFFPENNGNASDPMPPQPSLGASAALHLSGPLWIELTEDLYFTHYAYNYTLDRAVPAAVENRSAFVFGFLTGLQALGRFPLNDIAQVRVYGGPAADFRAIALAGNLHPTDFTGDPETDPQIQTDSVRDYFWGRGRWLMPVIGAGMDFLISENLLAGFDLRMWIPVYRLWSGEELPDIEGWRFGVGLRVTPRGK